MTFMYNNSSNDNTNDDDDDDDDNNNNNVFHGWSGEVNRDLMMASSNSLFNGYDLWAL